MCDEQTTSSKDIFVAHIFFIYRFVDSVAVGNQIDYHDDYLLILIALIRTILGERSENGQIGAHGI